MIIYIHPLPQLTQHCSKLIFLNFVPCMELDFIDNLNNETTQS